MDCKMKKSHVQNLKFLAIIGVLLITSFFSQTKSSTNYTNSKYNPIIHLILNILILAVGADSGLLSFFLHSPNHPPTSNSLANDEHRDHDSDRDVGVVDHPPCQSTHHRIGSVRDNTSSELGPAIFFINEEGCNSIDYQSTSSKDEEEEEEDEDDDNEGMSEQELYHKAETFIGNFYKQLKMQREDSWNKLHESFSQH